MTRITIDIGKEELDFIREALAAKYLNLLNYLNDCEKASLSGMSMQSVLVEAHEQLQAEIDKWTAEQKTAKKRGRPRKNAAAPYGLKKDGTPKKAPGRPKVVK